MLTLYPGPVMQVTLTPNIEAGATFSQKNGCGCKVASVKSNDTFNWFEFSFQNSKLEPSLLSMLLGSNPRPPSPSRRRKSQILAMQIRT